MSDKRTYEPVKYTFNGDELRELGELLARLTTGVFDLEKKKSSVSAEITARIKEQNRECGAVAERINAGYELREVECLVLMETPRPGIKRVIRMDTNETIREEPMTLAEMQTSFGFNEDSPDEGTAGV